MFFELHGHSQARVDVAPYENLPEGPGAEALVRPVAVGDQGGGHGGSCRETWGRGGRRPGRRPGGSFFFWPTLLLKQASGRGAAGVPGVDWR